MNTMLTAEVTLDTTNWAVFFQGSFSIASIIVLYIGVKKLLPVIRKTSRLLDVLLGVPEENKPSVLDRLDIIEHAIAILQKAIEKLEELGKEKKDDDRSTGA